MLNEIQYPNDNIGHLKMANLVLTSNGGLGGSSQLSNDTSQLASDLKLKEILAESIEYQFQLNLNMQLINRLSLPHLDFNYASGRVTQDKLKMLSQHLLKTLICLPPVTPQLSTLDVEQAFDLFKHLCIYGNLEKECSAFLVKFCACESWWGAFIARCLRHYFVDSGHVREPLILSKIFLNLNEMCMKAIKINGSDLNMLLFKNLFELINSLLAGDCFMNVEISALEWLILFVTRLLNLLSNSGGRKKASNRWEFLEKLSSSNALSAATKNAKLIGSSGGTIININTNSSLSKNKFKKKLLQSSSSSSNVASLSNKQLRVNKRKIEEYNRQFMLSSAKKFIFPRDISLALGKSLARLLVSSNSYSSSDLFVLTCRVLSSLCLHTQPALSLHDMFGDQQTDGSNDLHHLVMLNVSLDFNHGSVCWGSPWSQHALLCLLSDVVESEKCAAAAATPVAKTEVVEVKPSTSAAAGSTLTDLGNFFQLLIFRKLSLLA